MCVLQDSIPAHLAANLRTANLSGGAGQQETQVYRQYKNDKHQVNCNEGL